MLYSCDWCGDVFDDRSAVASVDVTVGAWNESAHLCAACAPDFIADNFDPDAPTNPVIDGPFGGDE